MPAHPIGTFSSCIFSHFFRRVTAKKYRHRSKWGLIPKNPSHRACNVLDPIGSKVLQLHIVVIQQPPKKLVGRGGESPLVEVSEGHNIAFGRRQRVLVAGQPPLLGGGPRAKKATANEALQALEGDIGSAPRLH